MTTSAMDGSFTAPTSPAQDRMWVLEELAGNAARYNIQTGLRFHGTLDVTALRQAVNDVVARHELLRTTLVYDGERHQRIAPAIAVDLVVVDAVDGDATDRLAEIARDELAKPFDVSRSPGSRWRLIRFTAEHHVLLVTLDHIIADGWSLQVLHDDLCEAYRARCDGGEPDWPELPIQYADYAAWQREWLAGSEADAQVEYWRGQLAECEQLDLSTVGDERGHVPGTSRRRLPLDLIDSLERFARQQGSSLFMVLLSGYAVLLHRLTGRRDIVIGSLLHGRTQPETELLVGFFVNTVALRADLSGMPSFTETHRRIRETILQAYGNQDVPYERVVAELNPVRLPGRQPFCDVMFQLADVERPTRTLPTVRIEQLSLQRPPADADLVLTVLNEDGGYVGVWNHDERMLPADVIRALQDQFELLLRAGVGSPDRPITQLPTVAPRQREWLSAVAGTASSVDGDWHAAELFKTQAARTPHAVALVGDHGTHSYAQLDQRADCWAAALRRRGIGPESIVGLSMPRGADTVTAILAVWKAGAAYVPLDPQFPHQHLAYLIEDAMPGLVITADIACRFAGVPVVEVADLDAHTDRLTFHERPAVMSDTLAYLIYTSGSTGRPKAVAVEHRGLGVVVAAQRRTFGLGPGDRVLQYASPNFDASVFDMLQAFGSGAALHCPGPDAVPVADLADYLGKQRITYATLTPSTLAAISLDRPLPDLGTLALAGEVCPPSLADAWSASRRLFNLYGTTEASIWSTWHPVTPIEDQRVPIGQPVPGVTVRVLTADLEWVPPGFTGELFVGGEVVGRGYLRSPALTAERFVPDPYADAPGARLYRTGDQARVLPDGTIEFLGRSDHQVKVRGFRVELGEIEAFLASHTDVRQAAVVRHEDALLAYVVSGAPGRLAEGDVLDYCRAGLPGHCVPSAVIVLPELPYNMSGKLDRGALPLPGTLVPPAGLATTSPLATEVAQVWGEILSRSGIRASENFFTIGGHSLAATRVITMLRESLGVRLPVRLLFEHPVLADFVDAVRSAAGEPS
ncbi:amino acid adenylation domain-containing protein [Streptomyces sp. NPDC051217]|uniref:amino acid adenylation domain-containing protein n=1 Tax=Streptomyces sp. NPDC051217 TaxID=3365644 RepID=UPI00378B1E32